MTGRKYYTRKDDIRNGWCVFIKDSKLISRFVAGAFESKEKANAECSRLNGRLELYYQQTPDEMDNRTAMSYSNKFKRWCAERDIVLLTDKVNE